MRRSTLLLVLFVTPCSILLNGCRTGDVGGASLSLGSTTGVSLRAYERGLWFDHEHKERQPSEGFGLKFDLVAGQMVRPIPKFWKAGSNPWKGGDPWFVLRCPMVGPYISVAAGNLGAYFGFKSFRVADEHRSSDRYGKWMHESEFPEPNGAHVYLQPSASLRRTRWK
jgi:hypothetical protein